MGQIIFSEDGYININPPSHILPTSSGTAIPPYLELMQGLVVSPTNGVW